MGQRATTYNAPDPLATFGTYLASVLAARGGGVLRTGSPENYFNAEEMEQHRRKYARLKAAAK